MFSKTEQEQFYHAVASRDFRFDGRFFVGVKTTAIYCRPICPARPLRKNMEFFKTSWEAERAGYRPCLRCRPEAAPQSPAWIGTSAVVKRALRLIGEGYLFGNNEKNLAERLGMTERHLRRLFIEEIGSTPKKISDTRRLNFARALTVDTTLPLTEVALNSGFNSIRRFNDAFQKRFAKKPSDLRKKKEMASSAGGISLYLHYRPPYDWGSISQFFKSHAAPGIEAVIDGNYQRLFLDPFSDQPALFTVSDLPERHCLKVTIQNADTRSLFMVTRRVRKMFDLDSDPLVVANMFASSKWLKRIYEKNPGLRIPSGWDAFETAVATVLGQFVSIEHGRKLLGQLIEDYGDKVPHSLPTPLNSVFPSPARLDSACFESVKTTKQRKETLRQLARQVRLGDLGLSDVCDLTEIRRQLRSIKGIGPWSVEYICLRALGDTDAFPAKDLILGRVLREHPHLESETLQPWRSYLALYLWREFAHPPNKKGGSQNVGKKNTKKPGR